MGLGFRTDQQVSDAAAQARKDTEGMGTYDPDTKEVKIYSKDDLAKMTDKEVLFLQAELKGNAQHGLTQETKDAIGSIIMTQWGWSGTTAYKDAVKKLNEVNTPEGRVERPDLNGKVPTKEEAIRMIKDAGGKVKRIEGPHGPDSVSTHKYPHINYETASGVSGTVRIQQ
jgi:hypothetical protein